MRPNLGGRFCLSPKLACTATFLVTAALMSPHYTMYSPVKYLVYDEYSAAYTELYTTEPSFFAKTNVLLLNSVAAFRSITMFMADICLNSLTIYYFKNFLSKQNSYAYNQKLLSEPRLPEQPATDVVESVPCEMAKTSLSKEVRVNKICERKESRTNAEKSITFMVIVHCSISLAHQILLLATFFYVITSEELRNSAILVFTTNYVSATRQASNFFLFYSFNKNFQRDARCQFKKMFHHS
jgi:hypothetical protein